jgi:hypothetical protein
MFPNTNVKYCGHLFFLKQYIHNIALVKFHERPWYAFGFFALDYKFFIFVS